MPGRRSRFGLDFDDELDHTIFEEGFTFRDDLEEEIFGAVCDVVPSVSSQAARYQLMPRDFRSDLDAEIYEGVGDVLSTIGQGVVGTAQVVGKGVKAAAKGVGKAAKFTWKAGKTAGKGVGKAAKFTWKAGKKVGKGVGKGVKAAGRGVKKAGQGIKTVAQNRAERRSSRGGGLLKRSVSGIKDRRQQRLTSPRESLVDRMMTKRLNESEDLADRIMDMGDRGDRRIFERWEKQSKIAEASNSGGFLARRRAARDLRRGSSARSQRSALELLKRTKDSGRWRSRKGRKDATEAALASLAGSSAAGTLKGAAMARHASQSSAGEQLRGAELEGMSLSASPGTMTPARRAVLVNIIGKINALASRGYEEAALHHSANLLVATVGWDPSLTAAIFAYISGQTASIFWR